MTAEATPETLARRLQRGTGDPIERLEWIGALYEYLAEEEERLVPLARKAGASWLDIGQAVGRTRQAVWARYHEEVGQ